MTSVPLILAPLLFVVGLECFILAVFRAPLSHAMTTYRTRRHRERATGVPTDPHGLVVPLPALDMISVLLGGMGSGIGLTLLLAWLLPAPLALMLCFPLTLGATLGLLALLDGRARRRLDDQVVDAAARVAAAMTSGATLNQALRHTADAMPAPLATPWRWMVDRAGSQVPDGHGGMRTVPMAETAEAVAAQVAAPLLIKFLQHVAAATALPQPQAQDRMTAASIALGDSRLRIAQIKAKLTHSRVSGLIILGVGVSIAVFLYSIMPKQWEAAFSGPYGVLGATVILLLFSCPVFGIVLLSRMPSIDL